MLGLSSWARLRRASLADLARKFYFLLFRLCARAVVAQVGDDSDPDLSDSISFQFFNRRIKCRVHELLEVIEQKSPVSKLESGTIAAADEDPRYLWEFNRLAFLASTYIENEDGEGQARVETFVDNDLAFFMLRHWVAHNSSFKGSSWVSAMESSYRLIAILLRFYINSPVTTFSVDRKIFLDSVCAMHQRHILAGLSRGSSLNNHTIIELCALVVDACIRSNDLKILTQRLYLLNKALDKLYTNGVLLEYSAGYQIATQDVLDLTLSIIPAKLVGNLGRVIQRSREVSAELQINEFDGVLVLGDWDYSRPIALGGDKRKTTSSGVHADCFLTRSGRSTLLVDGQPSGLPPLLGHARDDVGQVQLYSGETQIIGSGGTTSYGLGEERRRFERSYQNHSTLRQVGRPLIHGVDAFVCEELYWPDISWQEVGHLRASLGITYQDFHHKREVSLAGSGAAMMCVDTISACEREVPIEITWILPSSRESRDLVVKLDELRFTALAAGKNITFRLASSVPFDVQATKNRNVSVGYCLQKEGLAVTVLVRVFEGAVFKTECTIS